MMQRGKLIVIDGTDGAGKATQTALLVEALRQKKIAVKKIDFPQYYNNFFGELIGGCLGGRYGDFLAVDPHIASVLYAADRWETKSQIEKWLNDGYIVVADRYVSANQIHQGGKILDNKKRKEFLEWLDTMEHKVFKIPRPDAILYLSLPIELTRKLLDLKNNKKLSQKKRYLRRSSDQHENDPVHLENAKQSALKIVEQNNKWIKIECDQNGEILPREEIHQRILEKVEKILKIKNKIKVIK